MLSTEAAAEFDRVFQTVEPEAARLLTENGGNIASYELHGMYYWDYEAWEDQCVHSFTPGTLAVYVSANGQEDTSVVFAVFLLPACAQELHMVYDYHPSMPAGPIEEYFTLRTAQVNEFVLRELRAMPPTGTIDQGKNDATCRIPTSHLARMYAATWMSTLSGCLENGCCSLWLVCQ